MTNFIAESLINKTGNYEPEIAIVTGSGLGETANLIKPDFIIDYADIKEMPKSFVDGHQGRYIIGKIADKKVICLQGRIHLYEDCLPQSIFKIMQAMKIIGVKQVIITNAAGSLDTDMPPSSIMMISDHINFSARNPLVGIRDGFISGDCLYDRGMLEKFKQIAKENNIELFEGVYLMSLGPNFETPAEIKMFQICGARAVGMSTVPEVLASVACGIKVAALSLITNLGSGISDQEISHEQTLKNAEKSAGKISFLIKKYIESL